MPDRRALILDRLEELLGGVESAPVAAVYRNRGEFPTDRRPCVVILEGGETVHQNYEGRSGRTYARNSSSVMLLEPELFVLLKARPVSESDEYKAEFAAYRNAIVRAVLYDQDLVDITGEHGDIAYRGHETDMRSGRMMRGEMQLFFRFYYLLNPKTDL